MDKSKIKTDGKDFKGGVKFTRKKSLSGKKSKSRKRNKQGGMQKGGGIVPTWKPFMK